MVWIIGIGVGLILFFSFPKQMFAVVLIGVVLAVGIFVLIIQNEQRRSEERRRELETVAMTARGDKAFCSDPRFPVRVDVTNRSPNRTLNQVTFSLSGYKPGYSSSVLNAFSLTSDRILGPGESYVSCWSMPYQQQPPEGYTYDSLQWEVSKSYVTWR
jgi:hypothetical protein